MALGDGLTSIAFSTFENCSGLTSITIPDSVKSIGDNAFSECSILTSVKIGSGVTKIGNGAFSSCSGLTSITLPDSLTIITDTVFYNCSALTSIIIPDGVTNIGTNAFDGCLGLTSATIPDSVTSIGTQAFNRCASLTSVTFPEKLKRIDAGAFIGTKIKAFKLPKSIEQLGRGRNGAFDATTEIILIDMSRAEAPQSLTLNKPWGAAKAKIFFKDDFPQFSYNIEKKGYERIVEYKFDATADTGLIQEVTLPDGNTISVGSQDTYEGTYTIKDNGVFNFSLLTSVLTDSAIAFPYQLPIKDIGKIDLQGNDFSIKKSNLDNTATIADLFTRGAVKATDIDINREIAVASDKTLDQIKAALINDKDTLTVTLTATNDFGPSLPKEIIITIDNSLDNSVKFVKYSSLLRKVMVKDGEEAKNWNPDSVTGEAGMIFDDWYSDKQLSNKFDFTTKITKDERREVEKILKKMFDIK